MPVLPMTGNHFIVCGDGSLAYRIASELTSRYDEDVVVVLPDPAKNYGPQVTALAGVTVLSHATLTSDAFVEAGIATARGLALVGSDDLVNFHAALRADELNPGLRIVVAAFNRRLGQHIRGFFRDCTVLSSSEMAAPSFVSAALGSPTPSHVRVSGRTLYVARYADVPAGHAVCGLEVPDDPAGTTQLIPPDELPPVSPDGASSDSVSSDSVSSDSGRGGLVLAVADGTPRDPLTRRRHPVRASAGVLWRLAWNKFALVFAILLAAVIAGFCLLLVARYPVSNAVYLTVMDMTGSALTSAKLGGPEKVSQMVLTVDGMALIPLVTAIIVGARLTGKIRGEPRPRGGHIIVVGLGNVGTRVVGELHDLGYDVACIDRDPEARGVALARRLSLPLVIGEAYLEDKLQAAGLETAAALVSVTSNDMVNLETALQARAMREDLRAGAAPRRRRPRPAGTEDAGQRHLAQRLLHGGAGLRRRAAGASGAAHDRGGTARPADRGRTGGSRLGHRGAGAGRTRAGPAGARAGAAGTRRAAVPLVAAPRLPARGGRPGDRARHARRADPLPHWKRNYRVISLAWGLARMLTSALRY